MARTEIDPQLPYIQVHRSVGAMAAQLAPLLAVSYQHARGGLDVFWEGLADRRVLAAGLALAVPMVLLTDAECRRRLRLAFGVELDPEIAATVGILEAQHDRRWRVRGMSRYLTSERKRLDLKPTPAVPQPTPSPAPTPPRAGLDPTRTPPTTPPQVGVPPRKGERREERGEREEVKGERVSPPALVSTSPIDGSADAFFVWLNERRRAAGHVTEHPPPGLSGWWTGVMLELNGDVGRAQLAAERFLADPHWKAAGCPFAALRKQWPKYASEHYGKGAPPKGAAPESDWAGYKVGDTLKGLGGGT